MEITAAELEALNQPGPSQEAFSALNIRDYLAQLSNEELYNEYGLAYERGIVCQEQMRKDISHQQRGYLLADMEAAIDMRAEAVIEIMSRGLTVYDPNI